MRRAFAVIRYLAMAGFFLNGPAAVVAFGADAERIGSGREGLPAFSQPEPQSRPLFEDDPGKPLGGPADATTVDRAAPLKARVVLEAIQKRHGEPLPGYVGGKWFHNRERKLPPGRYREYDVNAKTAGRNRGPERLVIEQASGKAYYTDDHYRTFIPMN